MTSRIAATLSKAFLSLLLSFELSIPQAVAQTTVYYQPTPYPSTITSGIHILDGWLPDTYYGRTFQRDGKLQIGGWGDNYRTYIQFDLKGLPASVSSAALELYAYPRGDSSTLVNFDAWSPNSAWASSNLTTSMGWDTQPSSFSLVGSYAAGPLNSFWSIGITSLYNNWKSGAKPNHGITLMPWTQNNNFDVWRSSRYTAHTQRPRLRLTFTPPAGMPNFKVPLSGNVYWLVTTETGGWDCKGLYDAAHDGSNWFSIDFSWRNLNSSGNQVYAMSDNIPVIAAASGRVVAVNNDPDHPNGYYVVMDHDGDGNVATGFSTRYLHLKSPPVVSVGQNLLQGDLLGYMGNTGQSEGQHLHFGMRYNNDGSASRSEITYAIMSSRLLKGFQTECADGDYILYYLSDNRAY